MGDTVSGRDLCNLTGLSSRSCTDKTSAMADYNSCPSFAFHSGFGIAHKAFESSRHLELAFQPLNRKCYHHRWYSIQIRNDEPSSHFHNHQMRQHHRHSLLTAAEMLTMFKDMQNENSIHLLWKGEIRTQIPVSPTLDSVWAAGTSAISSNQQ